MWSERKTSTVITISLYTVDKKCKIESNIFSYSIEFQFPFHQTSENSLGGAYEVHEPPSFNKLNISP